MNCPLNGGYRDQQALPVTFDETSCRAADYMKYVDLIHGVVLSLRREGRSQKLNSIRSVFRLDQDRFLRSPFQVIH
jgi:hypothetical protein